MALCMLHAQQYLATAGGKTPMAQAQNNIACKAQHDVACLRCSAAALRPIVGVMDVQRTGKVDLHDFMEYAAHRWV